MSEHEHDDRTDDDAVAGETLPECECHTGRCDRCGIEIKPKRRPTFKGEEKRNRTTFQIKVPKDAEDGWTILDDGFRRAYEVVADEGNLDALEDRTQYVCLADIFEWVGQNATTAYQLEQALEEIEQLKDEITKLEDEAG